MYPCPSPASRLLAKPRTTKYGITATTIATNSVSNGNIQLTASERPSGCSDESDFCYAKRFADHDFLTISAQTAVAKWLESFKEFPPRPSGELHDRQGRRTPDAEGLTDGRRPAPMRLCFDAT